MDLFHEVGVSKLGGRFSGARYKKIYQNRKSQEVEEVNLPE